MLKKIELFFLAIFFLFSVGVVRAEIDISQLNGIENIILLEDDIVSGGPPSEEGVKKAKVMGVKTIIDLRGTEEVEAEKEFVLSQGLKYFNIPVTPETLSRKQVDEVAEIISDPENRPVILHCSSGNRVGGLWALYSKHYKGLEAEAAYQEGLSKGMRSDGLKAITRRLLDEEISKKEIQPSLSVPEFLRNEHNHLHSILTDAVNEGGEIGKAAREVVDILHPHLSKEEKFALPPLSLLEDIANEKSLTDVDGVLELTDMMKKEYSQMLIDHGAIKNALQRLARVAKNANEEHIVHFSENVIEHMEAEAKIYYTTTILIGEYLKLKYGK